MSPRVAIACSGLGHVRRGNETAARGVAEALHQDGVDVTLFGGGPLPDARCRYVRVRSIPRESPPLRGWLSWERRYLLEQYSFEWAFRGVLDRGEFDIVQVPDPALALRLRRWSDARPVHILYQNSQLLGPTWCAKFDFVQVLAPYYLDVARLAGIDTTGWQVIPYLVDVEKFAPVEDRAELRRRLLPDVPENAFVALGVGDLSPEGNKRLEWLIREVGKVVGKMEVHLVIAGQAQERDLVELRRHAAAVLDGRVHLKPNVAPEMMAGLYAVSDVFVHAALREPFGMVFLEALASGLPVLAHPFEVTEWIVGDGGRMVDMTREGELAAALMRLGADAAERAHFGERARSRALSTFSPQSVVPLYRAAYQGVMQR